MITFVKGRSGRGKTTYIFDAIEDKLAQRDNKKIFLIVPDQMSFQTEYQLLSRQKENAMFNVEIVGISRFISRMLEEYFPIEFDNFDNLAQKMLLQYSVTTLKDELNIYNKNSNHLEFIDALQQFYRQVRGSNVALDEVLQGTNFNERPLLDKRLSEITKIFALFDENREEMTFDYADKIAFFDEQLRNGQLSKHLKETAIYIDGFHIYNHQERETLIEVLKYVDEGMVTFCVDDVNSQTSIFSIINHQMQYFIRDFPQAKVVDLNEHIGRFKETPLLSEFERNYEAPLPLELSDDFKVVSCSSQEAEVERAALGIRRQLLAGESAKEIALYVPSKETYAELIGQYFDEYEIPYFIDLKDKMLYHPLFQWLNAHVNIEAFSWRFEDLVDLSQNRYFWWRHGICETDYYVFLTHINRNRIFYRSMWENDKYWFYYDHPSNLDKAVLNEDKTNTINIIRQAVLQDVRHFEDMLTCDNIKIILENIYLTANDNERVSDFFAALEQELPSYSNHLTEASYHQAVWDEFIHILEQLKVAFQDLVPTKQTILDGLKLGIESAEFSAVPLGFDGVMIGDFERSRFQTLAQDEPLNMGVSHIYILGMVEGVLPHAEAMSSMLSEQDILYLHHHEIFRDVLSEKEQSLYQLFRFYLLITNTKKSITVSYYQNASLMSLEEQMPAALVNDLLTFGFMQETFSYEQLFDEKLEYLTLTTIERLIYRYKHHLSFSKTKLYQYAKTQPKLARILSKTSELDEKEHLHVESAKLPKVFSLSQIETFNRCEYQYFLKYVLKVSERVENEFLLNQSGSLMHGGFEYSINTVLGKPINKQPIEYYHAQIDEYFSTTKMKLQTHPLFQSATNNYVYDKILITTKQSFESYYQNEAQSLFLPKSLEHSFSHEFQIGDQSVPLMGKVDRIDISDDGKYIRIIDYKSSNRKLDFDGLYVGEQLQLPFYSYLVDKQEVQTFAGALYVPMVASITSIDGSDDVEALKQKSTKQTGFFLDDAQSIAKFDYHLETENKSDVITYALKKDGTPNAHSTSFSSDELKALEEYAINKAEASAESILEKTFKVEPLRMDKEEKSSPCTYCQFKSICQFDPSRQKYNDQRRKFGTGSFQEKKKTFVATSKEERK